jgi:hypothetical protein
MKTVVIHTKSRDVLKTFDQVITIPLHEYVRVNGVELNVVGLVLNADDDQLEIYVK